MLGHRRATAPLGFTVEREPPGAIIFRHRRSGLHAHTAVSPCGPRELSSFPLHATFSEGGIYVPHLPLDSVVIAEDSVRHS